MIVSFIISVVLIAVTFKIKRNKDNIFYLELSHINWLMSIFFFLLVETVFGTSGINVFIFLLLFLLFFIIDLLSVNYKLDGNLLGMKKHIFSGYEYVDLSMVTSIEEAIENERGMWKLNMIGTNYADLEIDIENVNVLFAKIAEVNSMIQFKFSYDEPEKNIFQKFISLSAFIAIGFYTAGFNSLIQNISRLFGNL
ncbi:MAG: hypothetical protein LBI06_01080 [Treponema sp.]|jgi:hypothetical protein|nr:hypothetical protein [Treponema sp.]